ncbi:MAG TPA: ERAP1-like C-terminal domain-containing protein, partial [Ktedonobacterales bacterium]
VLAAMTAYAHDAGAIEQARAWQARDAADPGAVDPTLTPIFARATAQFGDAATYERFLSLYEQRKHGGATPQQMEYYAQALGRFPQAELEARTLALLQGDTFPFITMGGLLASLLTQPRTQVAAWEWIKANWAMIEERAPMFIPPLVQISGLLPIALRADVAAFWEAHLHGEFAGSVARALEQMEQHADFQARTRSDLLAYFAGQAPAPGPADGGPADGGPADGGPVDGGPAPASAPESSSATFGARLAEAAPSSDAPAPPPLQPTAPITERTPRKRGGWLRRLFGGRR